MTTKAGKRRDPPMPGDVVERRGLWKVRVVGVNNAAPKNAKGGSSRQDAIERTLYKVTLNIYIHIFSLSLTHFLIFFLLFYFFHKCLTTIFFPLLPPRYVLSLLQARKQLKRSMRTREGKNRSYQNGTLRGGQQFTRQIREQQQHTDMDVDDRYLSHEEDKIHQLAGYFEARYRATTEKIPLFEQPDIASVRMKRRLMQLQAQGSQFDGGRGGSRWSSLDGGGSALLPAQEAAVGLGGHYLGHSLSLANLSSATKVSCCGTTVLNTSGSTAALFVVLD
jgi:hypothetical protein